MKADLDDLVNVLIVIIIGGFAVASLVGLGYLLTHIICSLCK